MIAGKSELPERSEIVVLGDLRLVLARIDNQRRCAGENRIALRARGMAKICEEKELRVQIRDDGSQLSYNASAGAESRSCRSSSARQTDARETYTLRAWLYRHADVA